VHARHIYGPGDVHWDRRLVDIFVEQPDGNWVVNYDRFHDMVDVRLAGSGPPA
jgi:hypothetical protein